jgi:hypothetical protein
MYLATQYYLINQFIWYARQSQPPRQLQPQSRHDLGGGDFNRLVLNSSMLSSLLVRHLTKLEVTRWKASCQCSPDSIRIVSGGFPDRISAHGRISQTIRIVSTDICTKVVKLKLFLNINPNPNNQAHRGQSQYHCWHPPSPLTPPSLINIVAFWYCLYLSYSSFC